ncbi:sulfotransferase domain-containing protein [Spirulina sp. 06S082]|uniref:sulfotransferase domain-containing protein n=1 Tax=Spirulina sp. 06S082 TaxID=3110248 RepID=UPI002B21F988|nr:sulfotransferase domain-containing protein [Spirulina sp. 06S082]MEA5472539.1 sulfotransferase domain-containing protein [Spirulina sp. 06S082]
MNDRPTVFHITHQKAGSQWISALLKSCAPDRYVPNQTMGAHYNQNPIKIGHVYPCLYLAKPNFEALIGSNWGLNRPQYKNILRSPQTYIANWYNFQMQNKEHRKFIVIRDLRDALVSAYFSFKISHPVKTKNLHRWRENLQSLDREKGFIYLMDEVLQRWANIQLSWLDNECLLIKYEDLVNNQYETIETIMEHCQIDIERQRLQEIVKSHSFENKTGRKKGEEDIASHERKGIAGDWQNHFSEGIKEEFKQRFGTVLIQTGYEKDINW